MKSESHLLNVWVMILRRIKAIGNGVINIGNAVNIVSMPCEKVGVYTMSYGTSDWLKSDWLQSRKFA